MIYACVTEAYTDLYDGTDADDVRDAVAIEAGCRDHADMLDQVGGTVGDVKVVAVGHVAIQAGEESEALEWCETAADAYAARERYRSVGVLDAAIYAATPYGDPFRISG